MIHSTYSHPPALGWQINPYTNSGSVKDKYSNIAVNKVFNLLNLPNLIVAPGKGFHNAVSYYISNIDNNDHYFDNLSLIEIDRAVNTVMYKKIQNSNFSKFAGYIPVIGMLIGLGRVISTIKDKNLPIKNKVAHILRGTIEFLNLGVLLLIPDLILTNCRTLHTKLAPANNFLYLVYSNSERGSVVGEGNLGPDSVSDAYGKIS